MYERGTKFIRVIPASYQPSESRPKQVGDVILTRVDHWKLHTPKILKARKCQHS